MAKQENDLGRDAIGKLVLRIAVPSMLAQFVSVLYSIVDRMYIGNIPVVGDVALAGVGVCGPVVTMVGSVAFLIGVGGAPLMSIKLGEKDEAGARRIMANCFLMLCVSSVALMAAIYPLARPMLLLFGASEATLPYAMAYFTTYLLGTPFALMATGLNQLIVCQGFARAGMKSILLGAVLNIVLDPVFIFALDMGVRGGALATVLSQMASCAYAVWFLLFSRRAPVSITFGGYSLRVMGRVLALGFSPFLIIAMDNVMIIAMNALLQRYGGAAEGDMLVTCATIAQSFMLVVTMPLSGITGGTQSILGYNYGACNMARVKQAVRTVARLCMGYALVMTLAGFALLFAAGKLVYDIKTEGSFWAILGALLLSIGAVFSLGFFFTAIARDMKISNLLCYVSYFVMIFLSGATMPKEMFPEAVKKFSAWLPLTYVVELLQGVFLGAAFEEYRKSLVVLGTILIVCTASGAALYRRKSWV